MYVKITYLYVYNIQCIPVHSSGYYKYKRYYTQQHINIFVNRKKMVNVSYPHINTII